LATKKISALTELTTPAGTEELIVNAGGTSKKIQIDNLPSSLADNSVTLAKMAGGTDGNLITYDASGDPAYVTTGSSGQVLTSGGTGVAPTFQTAAAGGADTSLSNLSATGENKVCQAWVNFNGSGTPSIRDSYNVSSITDNGTGDYAVNFTTAMANTNYAFFGTSSYSNAGRGIDLVAKESGRTTSAQPFFNIKDNEGLGHAGYDSTYIQVAVFGD